MQKRILTRLLCFAMTLLMLVCSCVSVMAADDGESGNVGKKSSLDEVSEILNADGYSVYYEAINAIAAEASKETRYSAYDTFFAEDSTTDAKQLTVKDSDGNDVKVVLLPADGTVSFKVDVPETAIYTIRIVYCTDPSLLSKEEVESVGFGWMDIAEANARFAPGTLNEGENGDLYYISNPALGLWAADK